MKQMPRGMAVDKKGLHPRNLHRDGYDFKQLIRVFPELAPFVQRNQYQVDSIDFSNPHAVKALNKALLLAFYGIKHWDIPAGFLCPPVPGRADYLHYLADLLGEQNGGVIPRGSSIKVLDIGTGANAIYPIIGRHVYGWHFVGTDIDPVALANVRKIADANPGLAPALECRLQRVPAHVFKGMFQPGEHFNLSMCNPPFHASLAEAREGAARKWKNLGMAKSATPALNFGGQHAELWRPGGEGAFIRQMIAESALFPNTCSWYTTLVSQKATLPALYKALKKVGAAAVRTIDMAQGQKTSRVLAWRFEG